MERLQIAVEEWELYTNGILLCKWFDSDTNIKTINEFVKEAKINNGLNPDDLELFAADWENDFLSLCSEHCNIEEVFNKYNELDLEDYQVEILEYLTDYLNYDLDEALSKIDDVEVYECSSFTKLAEQFCDEGLFGEIPAHLETYIDYEAMGRDLSFDYDIYRDKIYRVS
jgi:hypothetical protein